MQWSHHLNILTPVMWCNSVGSPFQAAGLWKQTPGCADSISVLNDCIISNFTHCALAEKYTVFCRFVEWWSNSLRMSEKITCVVVITWDVLICGYSTCVEQRPSRLEQRCMEDEWLTCSVVWTIRQYLLHLLTVLLTLTGKLGVIGKGCQHRGEENKSGTRFIWVLWYANFLILSRVCNFCFLN